MTIALRDYVLDQAGSPKAGLTVDLWEAGAGALTSTTTTDANGLWSFTGVDETKTWRVKIIDGTKVIWRDARAKIQLTDLDMITAVNVDTVNEHTSGAGVTVDGLLIKDAMIVALDYGQSFQAIVTTYTDTTHFKASGLTGKGNDFFNGYYAYVVWDAGGLGAAPQGEAVAISDYVSSDGTFTHAAFTTPVAVTDEVLIIHPYIWFLLELKSTNIPADVDTLLARLTALRAGYLDELDFDLNARLGTPAGASLAADLLTIDNLVDDLESRLTALRAGYLDELDFDLTARLGTPAGASLAADLLTIDNLVDDLEGAVGAIEGATTLHNKLTAARAALLDQITALRLAELDAANLPADIDLIKGYTDTLETELAKVPKSDAAVTFNATALASINAEVDSALNTIAPLTPTAGSLLDALSKAGGANTFDKTTDSLEALSDKVALQTSVDDLEGRLTATRAGYLDNLSVGAVAQAAAASETRLAELDAANLPADIDVIKADTPYIADAALPGTPTAGSLGRIVKDYLTGAVALASVATEGRLAELDAANIPADVDTVKALVDSAETTGPYSYTDAGGEQTVVEDTAVTRRRIWVEFSNRNMTVAGTFRLYRKVDGTNYDLYVTQAVLVAAGSDRAFDAEFSTNQAWKLTYQEDSDEGAARNVPYNVITQVVE